MYKHLLLALSLGLALSACDGNNGDTNDAEVTRNQETTSNTTTSTQSTEADQGFIDHMVPHHEMAVMMADDALSKASNPKTKEFARMIKQKQPPEVQQLKNWRQQWYGSAQTPPMDHSDYQAMSAGPDYDRKWTQMMIEHHQMAVDTSKQTLSTAKRSEIKQLAQKIIDDQSKEIQQLQAHLQALG